VTRFVVVKLGGHALDGADDLAVALDRLAHDLQGLLASDVSPILVHGAGPQISSMLERLGVPVSFVDGLRVTNEETMGVVAMTLSHVNLQLVAGLQQRGVPAVGVAGPDAGTVGAAPKGTLWGLAGDVTHVDPRWLRHTVEAGYVPVVNPVALGHDGSLLNCNADAVAGALAAGLRADALILLSDVDQLRRDPDDASSVMEHATSVEVASMISSGAIRDGMRPKMDAALAAVRAGASRVVLANGTRPGALQDALSGTGRSTVITA